jgi:hypothetical protein
MGVCKVIEQRFHRKWLCRKLLKGISASQNLLKNECGSKSEKKRKKAKKDDVRVCISLQRACPGLHTTPTRSYIDRRRSRRPWKGRIWLQTLTKTMKTSKAAAEGSRGPPESTVRRSVAVCALKLLREAY